MTTFLYGLHFANGFSFLDLRLLGYAFVPILFLGKSCFG
jgi:hypothetical protein